MSGTEVDLAALGEVSEAGFHNVQEAAARPVDPTDVIDAAPSILANVLQRMQVQADAFAAALAEHCKRPDDNDVYNELLRIAYNFADGARSFLGLMVGICDLKPLIFWLTVFEQVDLAHRFAKLPFSLVGRESHEQVRSTLGADVSRGQPQELSKAHPRVRQDAHDQLVALGGGTVLHPDDVVAAEGVEHPPAHGRERRLRVDLLALLPWPRRGRC